MHGAKVKIGKVCLFF